MKAAGLQAIDTVVNSTAVLVKSRKTSNPLVELITSRIQGVIISRQKVRPMPLQYSPQPFVPSSQDHPRKACSNCNSFGRRGLGCRQFYGGEEAGGYRDGRIDQSGCNGHIGVGYCELSDHMNDAASQILTLFFFFFFSAAESKGVLVCEVGSEAPSTLSCMEDMSLWIRG
ncbi:ATP phosphoribosyltransferase [Coccidioides immitis H538.4]|nr:ATP phosphoribosyltransferase [Coccidioides immitis H538.4]